MRRIRLLPGLLLAAAVAGCDEGGPSNDFELTPSEAQRLIDSHADDPELLIVDTRTREEYDAGHIDGSLLIDFYAADFEEQIAALPRNAVIFLYCRSGNRSGQTATMMREMGFTEVYNLTAGFNEWVATGQAWTVM